MSIIIAFDSRNYAIKSMCANRWCRFQVKTIFAFISENVICLFGMTNGSFETQTERGMFIGKVTTKAEIATINHFACLWLFGNAVFVTHSVVCLPLEFLWRLTQNSAATQSYRSSEFSQNDQTYQKPNMQIHNHVFRTFFIGLPCSSKICSVCTVSENLCSKICSMGLNLTRRIVHSQIVLKTKRKHEMEKTKIDNTHKSHRVAKFTEN